MAVIIDIDHEGNNLTEYNGTTTDSGDLSVEAGAALAGTNYGLQLVLDDATGIYGTVSFGTPYTTSGILRARFYIDPNGLTMANGNNFRLLVANNSALAAVAEVRLGYTTGTGHTIAAMIVDDAAGETFTTYYGISDAPHFVEINLIRATNDSSADGSIQLWIDGVDKQTVGSKDNYDRFNTLRVVNFGAISGIDAGTNGTFFLDQLVANDDGSEIGPVSTGRTATLDKTLDNATLSSSAKVATDSDLSKTLGTALLSSSSKNSNLANTSKTLDGVSEISSGLVSNYTDLSATLESIENVLSGTGAIGSSSDNDLDDGVFSSDADVAIVSTLSKTLADATLSSSGVVGTVTATATLNVTLESITNVSSATNAIGGDEDTTLDNDTFDAEVDVAISSNLSKTLENVTLSSNGVVGVSTNTANLSVTLDSITNTSSGANAIGGDTDETLGTDTFDAEADVSIYGNSSNTLAGALFSSAGVIGLHSTGTLDVTLAAVTLIATGVVTPLPVSTFLPKLKYDVSYYDRHFEVSEYNRKSRIEKDATYKLKDTEG